MATRKDSTVSTEYAPSARPPLTASSHSGGPTDPEDQGSGSPRGANNLKYKCLDDDGLCYPGGSINFRIRTNVRDWVGQAGAEIAPSAGMSGGALILAFLTWRTHSCVPCRHSWRHSSDRLSAGPRSGNRSLTVAALSLDSQISATFGDFFAATGWGIYGPVGGRDGETKRFSRARANDCACR